MKKIINALLKTTAGRIVLELILLEFKKFIIQKLLSSNTAYRGEMFLYLQTSLDETIKEFLNKNINEHNT